MNDKTYTNWASMSDKAISEILGAFIRHHRLTKNKTQEEVAAAAAISRSTLSLLERGETVTLSTFIRVLRVLDLLYMMDNFSIDMPVSPLKLAKIEQQKRQRARHKTNQDKTKRSW